MHIEIKTSEIKPIRNTYNYVARRFGGNKPASRYQEATYDIQEEVNFHYRPLWQPDFEIFDPRRTSIRMRDWYAFKDPRQYYYGTYMLARAKQRDVAESNFAFVEKRNLLDLLSEPLRRQLIDVLLPLRHVEWGANMNNMFITGYAYGAAFTNATTFGAMDRLGMAQYLTRIGLALGNGQLGVLDSAKSAWLDNPRWQGLRRLLEDSFVVADWFEVHVAQNLVLDGLLYPLVYQHFETEFSRNAGSVVAMLTEFMSEWYAETSRWVDAVTKTAIAESPDNKALIGDWIQKWQARSVEALAPLAETMFGDDGGKHLGEVIAEFNSRVDKLGING